MIIWLKINITTREKGWFSCIWNFLQWKPFCNFTIVNICSNITHKQDGVCVAISYLMVLWQDILTQADFATIIWVDRNFAVLFEVHSTLSVKIRRVAFCWIQIRLKILIAYLPSIEIEIHQNCYSIDYSWAYFRSI